MLWISAWSQNLEKSRLMNPDNLSSAQLHNQFNIWHIITWQWNCNSAQTEQSRATLIHNFFYVTSVTLSVTDAESVRSFFLSVSFSSRFRSMHRHRDGEGVTVSSESGIWAAVSLFSSVSLDQRKVTAWSGMQDEKLPTTQEDLFLQSLFYRQDILHMEGNAPQLWVKMLSVNPVWSLHPTITLISIGSIIKLSSQFETIRIYQR